MSPVLPKVWPPEIECRAILNIFYGEHERQLFDLYLPQDAGSACPVLLWIHGGAWRFGNRGPLGGEAGWVAAGWAVARLNYRYSDHAPHPAQVDDARAVFSMLTARAEDWNLDPNQIVAAGHSAGGHIASMLGCTTAGVAAVINQAGPTDLVALHEVHRASYDGTPEENPLTLLLGASVADEPALARAASPVEYVDTNTPPHLLVFGVDDELVPIEQAGLFEDAMRAAGRPCARIDLDETGHVGAKFWDAEQQQRFRDQLTEWELGSMTS